ncbi:sulfurtransferase [Flavobacteriaceae bacterium F08102]|nr:sulfurtransferase [Flavobacteriaceae bacterium F08102]
MNTPIVSIDWLYNNFTDPNLIILDATIPKVIDTEAVGDSEQIKNARFFDIKKEFSEPKAPFPNTMVSAEVFEQKARSLGLNSSSMIVVYDRYGIYSSARAWYMLKAMGHQQVAVLDGGLPAWKQKGYPIEIPKNKKYPLGNFSVNPIQNAFVSYKDVLQAIDEGLPIVDARSPERFLAQVQEPRPGLRSGHIPSSKNLPYTRLLNDGFMLSPAQLNSLFKDKNKVIFSCGSGVTACVLALGATLVGLDNHAVYDGSWTEWGSLQELPIEP